MAAMVVGLVVVGYLAYEYRKSFIRSFFERGPGQAEAPELPAGESGRRLVRPTDRVRVVLIDGLGRRTAMRMSSYSAFCESGLDMQVDVGFPTVSLPVQAVLWTGLTQQQSGIQYVWKLLAPPLDALPAAVGSSTAVAEDDPYIVHSFGFENTLPDIPDFDDEPARQRWIDDGFESAALAAAGSDDRLVFVHVLRTDSAGHESGPESERYREAAASADRLLGRLTARSPPGDGTLWLVLSDHGHVRGGGHAGAENEVRIVRACLVGGGLRPSRVEKPVHMVDLYRALATALNVETEVGSAGRALGAAIAAPDSTGATVPRPGARWILALLVVAVALLAGLIASRLRWWGFAWWLVVAYGSVALIEAAPTLSRPMIYKPMGRDMFVAALPGLLVLAVSAGFLLRRHGPARVTIALLGLPIAATVSAFLLCHGQPPLMPIWTAHASLFSTLLATSCWVVALAHLVVSVPREFGPTKAPGTSHRSP